MTSRHPEASPLRLIPRIAAIVSALLPPIVPPALASPDRYGALAAQEILKAGGDAVDAAVAK